MKKILIVTIFLLFVLSVVFCIYFGPQIRDTLSPVVECTRLSYSTLDGITYPILPEEAVQTDEMGMTYIYIIESTDEYPEAAYKAVRIDVFVEHRVEGITYLRMDSNLYAEHVVLFCEEPLREGQRVRM